MTPPNKSPGLLEIQKAKHEAEASRMRLASTSTALKARLKPANIANQAWTGVRDKSGEIADGAMQAVRHRPLTVSGVVAGVALFLARDSIWASLKGLFSHRDESLLIAEIDNEDTDYDIAAPIVSRSINEGVTA